MGGVIIHNGIWGWYQFTMGLYKSLLTITERRKDKNQDKDMVQVRHLLKVGLDQQM